MVVPLAMNRPLTNQQQSVYDFIREKIVTRGYGPTVREIGEHMNIKSPNGVMCHLRALERKGMIRRTANKSRAIELAESISRLVGASLAVEGRVAAGSCEHGTTTEETVDLALLTCNDGRYLLRVHDDSLLDAQISRGDLLIMQKQSQATAGQLAMLRTDDASLCLRYWMPEAGRVRLQPVTRSLPTTIVDHAEVLAVVVGVIRSYESLYPPQAHN